MTVKGTLKADSLTVTKLTIEFGHTAAKIDALASLTHEASGALMAWTQASTAAFSAETLERLQEVRLLMEQDIARFVLESNESSMTSSPVQFKGIGEHVGGDADGQQI